MVFPNWIIRKVGHSMLTRSGVCLVVVLEMIVYDVTCTNLVQVAFNTTLES